MNAHDFPATTRTHDFAAAAPGPAKSPPPPLPLTVREALNEAIREIDARLDARGISFETVDVLMALRSRLAARRDDVALAMARAM
jgi:hypothetical protein